MLRTGVEPPPLERGVVDDLPAPAAARAGGILPKTVGATDEARISNVEHLAAVAAREQERLAIPGANQLKALERMTRVEVERGNALRGNIAGSDHRTEPRI